MDSVAVIIPTFDRRQRVTAAIESVLAQTRPADEILVVDDGSTDGTVEHLRATFAAVEHPRLTLLGGEHRGVSAARNVGIATARSEWLAFLDSDDLWQPEKLARQARAWTAAREQGAVHRVVHCDEVWIRDGRRVNPRRRHRKRGGRIFRHCLPLCAISPSAVVIHRDVFAAVGPFDETFPACEDYELWLRVTSRFPVLFVDKPLVVKHGGHGDQLSRTVQALDRYRIRALEKILAAGVLDSADARAAARVLVAKIDVYARGAERRGRVLEAAELARLRTRWREAAA